MRRPDDPPYRPVRPSLAAQRAELAALLRPAPRGPDPVPPDGLAAAGDAGPVVVLPALGRGDGQTAPMRRWLRSVGFDARGWGLGVNLGPTRRVLEQLDARLDAGMANGSPVNLIGLSMGGLFARWAAQRRPEAVRRVITVCTPFRSPLDSFLLPLRRVAPLWPCDMAAFLDAVERRPLVPSTCLYSVSDGIVAWASCLDPDRPAEAVPFAGAHVTMAANRSVWSLVAGLLLRPPG